MIEIDKHHLVRLVTILDGAQDALDAAAKAEERRERGKTMRQVTAQKQAKAARELVKEVRVAYDIPL